MPFDDADTDPERDPDPVRHSDILGHADAVGYPEVVTPTPSVTPTPTASITPLNPAIQLVKTVEGAPDGTVHIGEPCADPSYYYQVTNTGDTYLSDIEVRDDGGTPGDPGDDILIGTIPGPLPPAGNAGLDYIFDRNAVRLNTAVATGNPTDSAGNDIPGLPDVSDSDTALSYTWLVEDGNDYNGDGRSDMLTWKCGGREVVHPALPL